MCYALLLLKYRGEKENPKPQVVDTQERLQPMVKEAMQKPECVQVDVFLHQESLSMRLVTEWRPRSIVAAAATSTPEKSS